jgi:hypothetical protein
MAGVEAVELVVAHRERLGEPSEASSAWWSFRCLSNIRWLVEHGYGPPETYPEVDVLNRAGEGA